VDGSAAVSVDTAVVLVGPATVSGPHDAPAGLDVEALACVDDELALVDDRVVSVDALWSELVRHVMDTDADTDAALLVCPSWWTSTRIRRVVAAAETTCPDVAAVRRWDALCTSDCHVVEVAPELVAMRRPDTSMELVPRIGDRAEVVHAVLDRLRAASRVVIDAPSRVDAEDLVDDLAEKLRGRGVAVTRADDASMEAAARLEHDRRTTSRQRKWAPPPRSRVMVAAGVVLSVSVLAVTGLRHSPEPDREAARTWLVEGRVAVEVPADWRTERIVVGPGSARVQVMSPVDPHQGIHVTQSAIPRGQSLAAAAEVVRAALTEQPDGVFGGFDPAAVVADEPAITYRETRPDRVVDWTLVLDDGVRIAVGCQSAPGGSAPDAVCEHAIRSARAWG
jgi:type VII secretion-associated protein (TIGR03931 family)